MSPMKFIDEKVAGLLLFIGGALFLFAIEIGTMISGQSISLNYLSELAFGSSALIWDISLFILGIIGVIFAFLIYKLFSTKNLLFTRLFSIFFILFGVGAMMVVIFPAGFPMGLHSISALIAFGFGGAAMLVSFKLQEPPLSYITIVLAIMELVALVLYTFGIYLGLGPGGMERMIVYPAMIWTSAFGTYLMQKS
ncbi:MAG: DUF998 domain-containing protein [Promethearchaeota archaeon]